MDSVPARIGGALAEHLLAHAQASSLRYFERETGTLPGGLVARETHGDLVRALSTRHDEVFSLAKAWNSARDELKDVELAPAVRHRPCIGHLTGRLNAPYANEFL